MSLFGIGGSASKSKNSSNASSFVDPLQQQYTQRLYGQANDIAQNQITGGFQDFAEQSAANLSQEGATIGGELVNQAQGQGIYQQGLQDLGSNANPYLDAQIQGLGGDIQRFLSGSLQGIGQGFQGAGQYGSSRQGLAEGQAITGAINEFGQQAANLRGGDLTRQASALQAGGALQQNAAQQGLGALQDRFDLGIGGFNAQFNPLLGAKAVIGDPTILQQSESKGKSGSASANLGFL